jgi:hypothetical protein
MPTITFRVFLAVNVKQMTDLERFAAVADEKLGCPW